MTKRIDHAAESNRIMEEAKEAIWQYEGGGETSEMINAIDAHRHAVLALVEQQRIANLIAIMADSARKLGEGNTTIEDHLTLHAKINPILKEVLGL